MSKQNNVNPDHYKIAGRERQGEAIDQDIQKQEFAQQQAEMERWQAQQKGLPPWEVAASVVVEPEPVSPRPRAGASKKTRKTHRRIVRRPVKSASRNRPPTKVRTRARRSTKSKARPRRA